ncbi:MAG: hypothetical protein ACR2PL_10155 [Dehalococcoidia bacterium]
MTNAGVDFPLAPSELTAEWLTRVLREGGRLSTARVTSFATRVVGEGVGFVGQLARIRLQYDRPEAAAPSSLVGKFPSPNEGARQTAAIFGVYAREVGFYQDLGDTVVMGTPRCYYAAITLDRSGFLLLLEDLDNGRFGDQVTGCSPAEARLILAELAKLHAQWWNSPTLEGFPWMTKGTDLVRGTIQAAYAATWPVFLERFREELTPRALEHSPALGQRLLPLLDRYDQRTYFTFAHSDFRLDNIFFPAAGEERRIVVVDWQGSLRAWSGAYDVAYFLGTSITTEALRAHRTELIQGYHQALESLGVGDYPYDQFYQDCREGLLFAFAIIGVIAGGMLDIVNERAVDLYKSFFSRLLAAIEDENAWELAP